jgi:hypothetical protein
MILIPLSLLPLSHLLLLNVTYSLLFISLSDISQHAYFFCDGEFSAQRPTLQAGGPSLFGYPQLLVLYIHSYSPSAT